MPQKVFRDTILENEFNKKGYVSVPFLNEDEISSLKEIFFETINESGGPKLNPNVDFKNESEISYDFTFIDNNVEYKKKVFDIITSKFNDKANEYLFNYKPIIANYIRKKENGGEVPMHQNWAFVDEEKYTSVSIWVPLVDSNEENGTLQLVDGSHKRFGKCRGPMVPWELRKLKEEIVARHLTPMNVTAGQAVILDDSIVHYSNANKTSRLRLAIQLIMIPENASSVHYHLEREADANSITMYETDVEFYTHFHPWLKPNGLKEIKKIPFTEKTFTYEDFLQGLKSERFDTVNDKKIGALFKNEKLQQQFEEDGYVKIPLLNPNEVIDLKEFYLAQKHEQVGAYGFHVSLDNSNEAYVNGVFEKLFSVLVPKLNPLLNDYKPFTASYVIKEAGLQNIVPPHQDWTFVDETEFCSATVWIPLMDVNKNNGALSLIKGSHHVFNEPRCSPSPQAKSVLSNYLFDIFPYVEVIDMKAGEALIFNNRTIHASPPNTSGITRMGVGIGITQKNAQLLHHYQVPNTDGMVNVYKVEDSFFKAFNNKKLGNLYNNGQVPELEVLKTYKKNNPNYTKEEIIKLITTNKSVVFNAELVEDLAAKYNYDVKNLSKVASIKEQEADAMPAQETIIASAANHQEWVDPRSFFQKYSIPNIVREIKFRLEKK